LLLAATVRSFAQMPLGISDRNKVKRLLRPGDGSVDNEQTQGIIMQV